MSILTPGLLNRVIETYVLPSQGIHGLSHWARVLENGRRLAPLEGADTDIVELFAVFHDACRMSEGSDRGHAGRGARGAGRSSHACSTAHGLCLTMPVSRCS